MSPHSTIWNVALFKFYWKVAKISKNQFHQNQFNLPTTYLYLYKVSFVQDWQNKGKFLLSLQGQSTCELGAAHYQIL